MSKSGRLRLKDIRSAYRLVSECRDLGADPRAWRLRMLEGLRHVVGSMTATGSEGIWRRPVELPHKPLQLLGVGFAPSDEAVFRSGISIETVKQYAKALHRHYGVSSRAELMAVLLRPSRPL